MRLRVKYDPQEIHPLSQSNHSSFITHHSMDPYREWVNLWLKNGLSSDSIGVTVTHSHLTSWDAGIDHVHLLCITMPCHSGLCTCQWRPLNAVLGNRMNSMTYWMSSGFPFPSTTHWADNSRDNKQTRMPREICIRAGEWAVLVAQFAFWTPSAYGMASA